MAWLLDADIDPAPLHGKRVAILGYGNQGRAQALNLRDGGIDVVVGLRPGSQGAGQARGEGLTVQSLEQAASGADLVMFLAPDEVLGDLYRLVEPQLRDGTSIGFSHGLAIHFGLIDPRPDLHVILIAPKGPGSALRSLYEAGRGMLALWAVAEDSDEAAKGLVLAYGRAIGCGRAGLIRSSFAEECEADLFNEQAVVWGAVPEILLAGFQTLVDNGISPHVAALECVGELRLLAELIESRGFAGMREAISSTAELGAVVGGPRLIDDRVREMMDNIFAEVRDGRFAAQLESEAKSDYPRLRRSRGDMRGEALDRALEAIRKAMPER